MNNKLTIKYLLSGSGWVLATKGISLVTGLVANGMVARLVTPDIFGVYVVLISIVSLGSMISQLGINQTIVRLVASAVASNKPENARMFVQNAIILVLLGSLGVVLVILFGGGNWILVNFFNISVPFSILMIISLWNVTLAVQNLAAESLRGFHDIRNASISGGSIGSTLTFIFFAMLLWSTTSYSLLQIVAFSVLSEVIGVIVALVLLRQRLSALPRKRNLYKSKMFIDSLPQWITNIALFFVAQINLWILGMVADKGDVAFYGAANRLGILVATPLILVNSVVSPLIADLFSKNERGKLQGLLQLSSTLAGIPSLILGIILVLNSKFILGFIYGDHYRQGYIILIVLGLGQIVNVLTGSCGITLLMTGHQKEMMVITLIFGLSSALAAFLVGARTGALGVAIITTLGIVGSNFVMWLIVKRRVGVWTHVSFYYLFSLFRNKFRIY